MLLLVTGMSNCLDRILALSSSVSMPLLVTNKYGTPLSCTFFNDSFAFGSRSQPLISTPSMSNTKPNSGKPPDIVCARVLIVRLDLLQRMRGCIRTHGAGKCKDAERNICTYHRCEAKHEDDRLPPGKQQIRWRSQRYFLLSSHIYQATSCPESE